MRARAFDALHRARRVAPRRLDATRVAQTRQTLAPNSRANPSGYKARDAELRLTRSTPSPPARAPRGRGGREVGGGCKTADAEGGALVERFGRTKGSASFADPGPAERSRGHGDEPVFPHAARAETSRSRAAAAAARLSSRPTGSSRECPPPNCTANVVRRDACRCDGVTRSVLPFASLSDSSRLSRS